MRETSFIEQNKEKWKEFEQILDRPYKDPDKLNELFVQITDDLSYSRTFYPNRSVRVYLNGLAQKIFFSIYKNRKSRSKRLISFWTDELPQLVYIARKEFRLSLLIFLLACGIGVLSGAMDPEFAEVILGEDYVQMTIENIESNDPMAVYKQKGEFGMTLGITGNNLFVAFLTFVMGVFFGIGTLAILLRNGIMLGSFQYFFVDQGLFQESFLTIWIHGTLEISAIIIAGAAGLTMGKGLLFPGTYTRLQAFQRSARRGIKIMVGIAPLIIMAGFFEGYLTRHTDTPDIIRGLFILTCLAFVLVYFVWYPWIKAKRGFDTEIRDTKVAPDRLQKINFSQIKSSGQIFADIFIFYKKYLSKLFLLALSSSALFCIFAFFFGKGLPTELLRFPSGLFGTLGVFDQFFVNDQIGMILLPVINLLIFSLLTLVTFRFLIAESNSNKDNSPFKITLPVVLKMFFSIAALMLLLLTNDWYTFFLVLVTGPIIILWAYVLMVEKSGFFIGLKRTLQIIQRNLGRMWGLFASLLLLGFLFFSITDTMLLSFYLDLVNLVVYLEQEAMNQLSVVLLTFITMLAFYLVYTLILIGMGLLYHSLIEINEAQDLKEKIKSIGQSHQIKGLAKEVNV